MDSVNVLSTKLLFKNSLDQTTKLFKIAEKCITLAEQGNTTALEIIRSSEQ